MNDRIGQLILQAGTDVSGKWISLDQARVLAQLIVRECVAICQDIDGEDNIDARSGRQDCAVEIKQHFGVEV
jgi:hypothetical protein